MPNHAHITIIGHLGKDPVFDAEKEVARFSVAHTRKRKAGDITTWYSVTAWRGAAAICAQYLKKGDAVGISGAPYLDQWKDKEGKDRVTLKIDATDVVLMGKSAGDTPVSVASTADTDVLPAPVPRSRLKPLADDDNEPPF